MKDTMTIPADDLGVIKTIRQNDRGSQRPSKNPVAHPCTHNLDPACPVRPADWDEVAVVAADALR